MRPRRPSTSFLQDILGTCDECLAFVDGMTLDEFILDRRTILAVEREIEIIGEAANNIPEPIRQNAPEVSWPRIAGMRNRLAHEYFRINYGIVWNTVHEDLPQLRHSIDRLLNESIS